MARATVFIGDLSRFCSDEDISSLFLHFGKVLETKIMRNPATGISLGYGFLIMGSTESALLAMQYLQGVQLRGRPLRVKWAGRNIKNDSASSLSSPRSPRDPSVEAVINSVHVRFQALHISSCLFTEESLYQFFLPFGEVTDASIKESNVDETTGLQQGYGFVHFISSPNGAESAFRAITEATGDAFFSLHCEGSRNFMKQFRGINAQPSTPQALRSKAGIPPSSAPNKNFRTAPHGATVIGKTSSPYYEINNFPTGSPYYNQTLTTQSGSEVLMYPPAPYMNSISSLSPNQAYCYTPAVPYGSVSSSNTPVMLSPPVYSQHSNMVGLSSYDSYPVTYPFFPVPVQMPIQTVHTGAVNVTMPPRGNYNSNGGPTPKANWPPGTRRSVLPSSRGSDKSRNVNAPSNHIAQDRDMNMPTSNHHVDMVGIAVSELTVN